MNEHYKMINDRFDARAGKLLSNDWIYRGAHLVDENSQMKIAHQAYFRNVKTGRSVMAAIVLYADDIVFAEETKQ